MDGKERKSEKPKGYGITHLPAWDVKTGKPAQGEVRALGISLLGN